MCHCCQLSILSIDILNKTHLILWYILAQCCITYYPVRSVANNLHVYDGTTTADIIGNDVFFEIVDPPELEYTYRIRPARDFGATFNSSYTLKNVLLVPMSPLNGCTPPNNIDDIEGNVALAERGQCSFKSKTLQAEAAGARIIIITDHDSNSDEDVIEMMDDNSVEETHIPAGFLVGKNGYMIYSTLQKLKRTYAIINIPVNLTFTPINKINQPPWLYW